MRPGCPSSRAPTARCPDCRRRSRRPSGRAFRSCSRRPPAAADGACGASESSVELPAAFDIAQREAIAAFGDGGLYVERLLDGARHVEVQVLADGLGGVLVAGDRECSIQRRHQKLVEEAPAPHLPEATRTAMHDACARAARAWGYRSAGTFEFLVDAEANFFFLELNARLQVEHPVTELVSGLDLVAEQLRVAQGQVLSRTGVAPANGHAIEVRVNAEDPSHGFRPSAGRLREFRMPGGPGVRLDTFCAPGVSIPPNYDSLIAKLCVWAADRPRAVARLRRALDEAEVEGVPTTLALFRDIVREPTFMDGRYTTAYLSERARPVAVARPPGGMSDAGRTPGQEGRRAGRTQAVVLLYQHDVTGLTLDELVENLERDRGRPIDAFTRALIDGVSVDAVAIDALISAAAEGWTTDRIAPLERNILRVAVHELLDWPEIPAAVSINEAVELAKLYCGAEAPPFVNGILGRIARDARPSEGTA